MSADSPWLTAAEAGERIKRSKRFILREVAAGRLRAARIGGRAEVLTRIEWLDEFLERLATPVMVVPRRHVS